MRNFTSCHLFGAKKKDKKLVKMALLDKSTNSVGLVVACDKKLVKFAAIQAIVEMRHLARSRNADEMFGVATNLYEW